jgi:dTDP-glucose 4,6-dehydratase
MSQNRVLITGGAGFLGSHLCERFLAEGYEVICMDNLITGALANVEHLFRDARFHFEQRDVTEYIHVAGRLDALLHFASPASPIDYLELPIQTLKVGSLGTHKALGLAREKGCRFLLASTSECYGDPLVHPQPETYWGNVNPVGERSCYDEGKRGAETLFMDANRVWNLDARIVRIFNTYGPRMAFNDGRVVSNFIVQALEGRSLTLFGEGKQSRSFCYVDDLIEGFIRVSRLERLSSPMNLGNPVEFTIAELAGLVAELAGANSAVEYKPLPADDPKQRRPDITKAQSLIQFEPKVALRQGLERTIADFKERLAERAKG